MYEVLKAFTNDKLKRTFVVGEHVPALFFSPLADAEIRRLVSDGFIRAITK